MESTDKKDGPRQRSKRFYERQRAEGKMKINVWLDPEGVEALEYLLDRTPGMKMGGIVNRALRYLAIKGKLDEKELEEALKGTGEFPA